MTIKPYDTQEILDLYRRGLSVDRLIKRVKLQCKVGTKEAKTLVERDIYTFLMSGQSWCKASGECLNMQSLADSPPEAKNPEPVFFSLQ